MAPTIYRLKLDFETQKTERFFKERRIAFQTVDLTKSSISSKTIAAAARAVGIDNLLNRESSAFKECPARFSGDDALLIDCAAHDPRMLRLPIVKDGPRFTAGFNPDTWLEWLASN